jgi:hypothetical protein
MIAQRNPRDMHGSKRSGKETFEYLERMGEDD